MDWLLTSEGREGSCAEATSFASPTTYSTMHAGREGSCADATSFASSTPVGTMHNRREGSCTDATSFASSNLSGPLPIDPNVIQIDHMAQAINGPQVWSQPVMHLFGKPAMQNGPPEPIGINPGNAETTEVQTSLNNEAVIFETFNSSGKATLKQRMLKTKAHVLFAQETGVTELMEDEFVLWAAGKGWRVLLLPAEARGTNTSGSGSASGILSPTKAKGRWCQDEP